MCALAHKPAAQSLHSKLCALCYDLSFNLRFKATSSIYALGFPVEIAPKGLPRQKGNGEIV